MKGVLAATLSESEEPTVTNHVSDGSFENDVLRSDRPVLVVFWAEWDAHWRRMRPDVATATDFDEHELISHCVRELASYKRPSQFILVDQLPRNALGKLLRRPLEQRARALVQDT